MCMMHVISDTGAAQMQPATAETISWRRRETLTCNSAHTAMACNQTRLQICGHASLSLAQHQHDSHRIRRRHAGKNHLLASACAVKEQRMMQSALRGVTSDESTDKWAALRKSGILTSEVKVPKGSRERQPLHLLPIMRLCGEVGHPFLPVQLLLCQPGSPTLLLQVGLVVLSHHHRLHPPTRHAHAMSTYAEPAGSWM